MIKFHKKHFDIFLNDIFENFDKIDFHLDKNNPANLWDKDFIDRLKKYHRSDKKHFFAKMYDVADICPENYQGKDELFVFADSDIIETAIHMRDRSLSHEKFLIEEKSFDLNNPIHLFYYLQAIFWKFFENELNSEGIFLDHSESFFDYIFIQKNIIMRGLRPLLRGL